MSRSATVPVSWISRSASVDLPWSICATMEKLRIWASSVMMARICVGIAGRSMGRAICAMLNHRDEPEGSG